LIYLTLNLIFVHEFDGLHTSFALESFLEPTQA
jgi:hypothetical protein